MKVKPRGKEVREVIKILEKEGFHIDRIKGSHICMNKIPSMKRPLIIPNHSSLSPGVKKNIIALVYEEGISQESLEKLYKILK